MVLRVADGEVPAELLLQAGVHALLRRGGGEVEGEQEQQVGQVGQTHPHLVTLRHLLGHFQLLTSANQSR